LGFTTRSSNLRLDWPEAQASLQILTEPNSDAQVVDSSVDSETDENPAGACA
jgi:hypothetical protein